eukprot:NODE_5018_length_610_cov_25.434938_g4329_i0.p1 GENE.NODE_5018_length_610_cov_25.434938_g4329_i0~~NODE_5018_length_610_cov_25.434938_g4329_i0.p1  ORF type:complete len:98 (+),score=14.72 NODE_5018_length_610_cov_25.434938_g4329_i0:140-433(+)
MPSSQGSNVKLMAISSLATTVESPCIGPCVPSEGENAKKEVSMSSDFPDATPYQWKHPPGCLMPQNPLDDFPPPSQWTAMSVPDSSLSGFHPITSKS